MDIFDVKAENEDVVFRRIEVFLVRKLKKKYPELDMHLDSSFRKDEKTIVTRGKTHFQPAKQQKRKVKKYRPENLLWQKNMALASLCFLVLALLWYILFVKI